MPFPIKKFLQSLKTASTLPEEDLSTLIKSFKADIPALDEAIVDLPVVKTKYGFNTIGDAPVGRVNRLMREANLPELVRLSKKSIPFTSVDAREFEQLVVDTPELANKKLNTAVSANKKAFPHLDVTADDFNTLSTTAKKDVKKIENNLIKYAKTGAKITLLFGTIAIGAEWALKGTQKRKGCWMITTIGGKPSSCKIAAFWCLGNTDGDFCPGTHVDKLQNTTLVLMAISEAPDTNPLKMSIAKKVGVDVGEMAGNLAKIIENNYNDVSELIAKDTENIPKFAVCQIKSSQVENGVIPPCRMCAPSDDPISTTYIDPKLYADNVTFQCSSNPSILDTITDAAKSTGIDIFDGVTTGLWSLLKPIFALVAVLAIICVFALIIMGIVNRKKNTGLNEHEIFIQPAATPASTALNQPTRIS